MKLEPLCWYEYQTIYPFGHCYSKDKLVIFLCIHHDCFWNYSTLRVCRNDTLADSSHSVEHLSDIYTCTYTVNYFIMYVCVCVLISYTRIHIHNKIVDYVNIERYSYVCESSRLLDSSHIHPNIVHADQWLYCTQS